MKRGLFPPEDQSAHVEKEAAECYGHGGHEVVPGVLRHAAVAVGCHVKGVADVKPGQARGMVDSTWFRLRRRQVDSARFILYSTSYISPSGGGHCR